MSAGYKGAMTSIPSVHASGAQVYVLRDYANARKTQQAAQQQQPTQPAVQQQPSAKAKVDHAMSCATYDAGLDTLRSANKMMMGYLLNLEV